MSFNEAKQRYYEAWIGSFGGDSTACWAYVNNRKLSQGTIRLEVELNTANNSFVFGVTQQQNNSTNFVFPTEHRLELQDSLVISEYGFFVAKPASRTDVNFKLRTYGNIVDFTAGAAAAIDGTLYSNSSLKVTVNNDVVVPYRDMFSHLYRPQTQQTAALGAGSPDDQIVGAEDGAITAEPNLLFIGSKSTIPEVILPGVLATVDEFTRLIFLGRGVLAQNSTVIN